MLVMENIKMHEFKHPKYYKELRDAGNELAKRNAVKEDLACSGSSPLNKSDQVISLTLADGCNGSVHPDPGLMKSQATSKYQASSSKRQAFEPTCSSIKRQASQP